MAASNIKITSPTDVVDLANAVDALKVDAAEYGPELAAYVEAAVLALDNLVDALDERGWAKDPAYWAQDGPIRPGSDTPSTEGVPLYRHPGVVQ